MARRAPGILRSRLVWIDKEKPTVWFGAMA